MGTAPPCVPDPPPRGTTGIRRSFAIRMIAAISCSEDGLTTTSGRPSGSPAARAAIAFQYASAEHSSRRAGSVETAAGVDGLPKFVDQPAHGGRGSAHARSFRFRAEGFTKVRGTYGVLAIAVNSGLASLTVRRLQHVSLPYPRGRQDDVRAFYGELLGLSEKPVPATIAHLELVWFGAGAGRAGASLPAR